MAEVDSALIFETLKSIQDRLGRMETRMERLESRLARVEGLMGDLVKADLARNADYDALSRRVDRIERRLELNDGSA